MIELKLWRCCLLLVIIVSATACGTPPTASDSTSPSKPVGLTATAVNSHRVDLHWTAANDDVSVAGYDIYRAGSLLATAGAVISYTDTTVAPQMIYQYQVQAFDAAGNRSEASDLASVTTPDSVLFSDGFESGDLSQWDSVQGMEVQKEKLRTGSGAVRALSTSRDTASYAIKQLSAPQQEIYYRVVFQIIDQQDKNSVYLMRFRTASNASLVGLYVSGTGKLGYRNDITDKSVTSAVLVSRRVWHEVQVRVRVADTNSQIEVWFDGAHVDALSKTESFGADPIDRVQLGENASEKTYDVFFDDVVVDTRFIKP
ncbi:MAG TPA: fibronectin type III domain-containing protein [Herpetosiphonaceae bacterium]